MTKLRIILLKQKTSIVDFLTIKVFLRAEDGTQTRDPQLGRLMLYQLSYFRIHVMEKSGQWWIRTTEGVSQLSYSQPHLATLVTAPLVLFCAAKVSITFVTCKKNRSFLLQSRQLRLLYSHIYRLHGLPIAACCRSSTIRKWMEYHTLHSTRWYLA